MVKITAKEYRRKYCRQGDHKIFQHFDSNQSLCKIPYRTYKTYRQEIRL